MQNQNEELIYSAREQYKIQATKVPDGINEMFDKLFYSQLKPYFEKMRADNLFYSLRAFADWDTGYNTFRLVIIGNFLPENFELENPQGLTLDASNFEKNALKVWDGLLQAALNEINKQNITGKGHITEIESMLAVLEFNYAFQFILTCDPYSEKRVQNAMYN